jgi:hypothetical protein
MKQVGHVEREMNMKKLWTNETPRQALKSFIWTKAAVTGWSVNDSLEAVLDGADKCPDGSPKREMLRWWDGATEESRSRLLRECQKIC